MWQNLSYHTLMFQEQTLVKNRISTHEIKIGYLSKKIVPFKNRPSLPLKVPYISDVSKLISWHLISGQFGDRRTMLGELNWIFTAITDTIAWNTLPRPLFQKLFRQDLLVSWPTVLVLNPTHLAVMWSRQCSWVPLAILTIFKCVRILVHNCICAVAFPFFNHALS